MSTTSIFFIDSRVSDQQALISALPEGSEWFALDADLDGLAQMASVLAGYADLDAIQILSHGAAGTLYLGSTVLSTENLGSYQSQLADIGASLTASGDILLYGCDVALGEAGSSFIAGLADLTGADVAASTNPTGAQAAGRD